MTRYQEVSLGDLRADSVPDPFDHLPAFLVELGRPVDAAACGSFGGVHAGDVSAPHPVVRMSALIGALMG